LGDVSPEANGFLLEGVGLVRIPETGRDTAGTGLAGCADVKEDGVIAGAEVESMSEGGSNGVSNGAGLILTSRGGRDGKIITVGSEVTGGAVRVEDVTAFSSNLRSTTGPAIAAGSGAILSGFRLALAPTTSRWTTQTKNTIADSAAPVTKAASTRGIRTFKAGAAALVRFETKYRAWEA